jgi:hypothetical protein
LVQFGITTASRWAFPPVMHGSKRFVLTKETFSSRDNHNTYTKKISLFSSEIFLFYLSNLKLFGEIPVSFLKNLLK